MVDKPKLILKNNAACTRISTADVKSNGGRKQCQDGSQAAEYASNCNDPNDTSITRIGDTVATWDYVITPPDNWNITSTEDVYSIQIRANFSDYINNTQSDSTLLEDQLKDMTWDVAITIAEEEDLLSVGLSYPWNTRDLYGEITEGTFKMGVKHIVIPQGSNTKISITPIVGKPHDEPDFAIKRTYALSSRQNVYMPYMTQIDITLDSDLIFVGESFETTSTIWEMFSSLGGFLSILSAGANVVLGLFLMGVRIPGWCCIAGDNKYFGYQTIPFNFNFRRQMDAFLDNFGGSAGKDLLIQEQELNHHYSNSNAFDETLRLSQGTE